MVGFEIFCSRWLSTFFKHVQMGLPGFAYGQAIFFVHVVWVHPMAPLPHPDE
jgi:hypothetical protein